MSPAVGRARVVWLATGLHRDVTGIERFALDLLDVLLERHVLTGDDVRIVADDDARWVERALDHGVAVTRWGGPPVRPAGRALEPTVRLVHNLGHAIFPRTDAVRLLTVCDWGPFTDRTMSPKARLSWAQSLARSARVADHVHWLNAGLEATRPRAFRRPERSFVAYPDAAANRRPAPAGPSSGRPLFVGTADVRKRLAEVVAFAEATGTTVTLVGGGTERHASAHVDARGRVSDDELDRAYAAASALLLVSSYEGFGIPVLEAARRGVHSVVSAEVAGVLPTSLRVFTHTCDPADPRDLRRALDEAEAARGDAVFDDDLLGPMVDLYASRLVAA